MRTGSPLQIATCGPGIQPSDPPFPYFDRTISRKPPNTPSKMVYSSLSPGGVLHGGGGLAYLDDQQATIERYGDESLTKWDGNGQPRNHLCQPFPQASNMSLRHLFWAWQFLAFHVQAKHGNMVAPSWILDAVCFVVTLSDRHHTFFPSNSFYLEPATRSCSRKAGKLGCLRELGK